jgi:phospholipid/cholesterol/gamma-HCH transport system permease protein
MIGVDPGAFWSQMQGGVDVWADLGNGVLKSFVFGGRDLRGAAAGL